MFDVHILSINVDKYIYIYINIYISVIKYFFPWKVSLRVRVRKPLTKFNLLSFSSHRTTTLM